MKKVLYLLVMLALVLAVLSACGEKKDPPAETDVLTPSPAEDFEYEIVEPGGLQKEGLYITKYIGSDEKVVIPGEIDGETVVGISYTREADGSEQGAYVGAFQNSSIQSVFIPASVGILLENAFSDCSRLTEVVFYGENSRLGTIGHAFENCTALETIDLSGTTVNRIGEKSFRGCTALKEIKFSEFVTYIGENVFENCTSLKEITIPASVVTLGMTIFKTPNLEKITFLGNCPEAYTFLPKDVREEIIIYYDPTTEGWNPWPWEDNCAHVSLTS